MPRVVDIIFSIVDAAAHQHEEQRERFCNIFLILVK
jgi:hypothetical protein